MPQYKGLKTVPKISVNDAETLALVYTPGVGASCLKIADTPDYQEALKRAIFLKSTLLIDAYPLVVKKDLSKQDLKLAVENIEINFCAIDLSLMKEFASDIEFSVDIPVLTEPVNDLKDFFGAIARNGDTKERSLQLHELAGGVIETELTEQERNKPVAVVSDGTAVLGFGNIGALAAIPVMEGKAALYSEMTGGDSISFCIKTQNKEEIIKIVQIFEDSFAAIHLEDIAAPACFDIENELADVLNIPVIHDDQHCTAIIVLAGLLNALSLAEKKLEHTKIVIAGAGAAGNAIAKLLLHAGAKNIILSDINGVVYKGRESNDKYLEELAQKTNPNNEKGTLKDVIKNADVFIGVSKGGILTKEMVEQMEYQPIIFALANPEPEIMPDEASKAGAFIVATGRSDYPNQINNLLAYPGLFKGLIDGKINKVSNDIKLECAIMIASMIEEDELTTENIIPDALNRVLPIKMAQVIAEKFKA